MTLTIFGAAAVTWPFGVVELVWGFVAINKWYKASH